MDEDDFEETRAATIEHVDHGEHPPDGLQAAPTSAAPRKRVRRDLLGGAPEQPGIIWVRASDLLNSGSGRVAGRGLDFEAELARRMRRSAATTRRAIRDRADRLPPLSAFGRSQAHPTFIRRDLGRR
ncbi:hypothetical protein [Agromyces sp. NPDC049794]|uniref:hypothetical protein n=1 Tax=unclassified Agromyces TaxID=2639701 RepID=UPI0033DE28E0